MSRWLDYEKMITSIYQELAPSAQVIHNDKVMGQDSGIERQIDVTIRENVEGEAILIAVQAKDYKHAADINTVGEFASVLRDIRATKGILICNAGFTKGALNLGRSWGIDLCSAHDAQSRNWANDITIPVLWLDISPLIKMQLRVFLDVGDSIAHDPREWILSTDRGKTRLIIFNTFVQYWNENRIPKNNPTPHHIMMKNTDVEILVGPGKWQEVLGFSMSYTVNKRGWLKYFAPIEFRAIKSFLTEDIDFTRLKLGLAPFKRDDEWVEVSEPEQKIVETKGLLVTSENATISVENIESLGFDFRLSDRD